MKDVQLFYFFILLSFKFNPLASHLEDIEQPHLIDEFGCEYLDKILSVKIVDDAQQAIEHIRQYSSSHTEVVVSQSESVINQFVEAIDSAVVMVNCSSRFSDGGELGLGAEIGISTSKLHWYGPMGLEALTIPRFIVKGQGQVRHSESLNLT